MADYHLLTIAHELGFGSGRGWWTWDMLVDRAVVAYWQQRPNIRPCCGSEPGYRAHQVAAERPCQPCRAAHAMVRAIARRRRARGLRPYRERPPLLPCGTHAAYARHKARGEPIDLACELGEALYHRRRYAARKGVQVTDLHLVRTSKLSVLTGYAVTTEVSGPGERKDLPA